MHELTAQEKNLVEHILEGTKRVVREELLAHEQAKEQAAKAKAEAEAKEQAAKEAAAKAEAEAKKITFFAKKPPPAPESQPTGASTPAKGVMPAKAP